MTRTGRNVLLVMLAAYVLGLGFCFLYSLYTVPMIETESFRRDWLYANTLEIFIRNLLPLHLSVVLFVYSLLFNPAELKAGKADLRTSFLGLIKRSLLFFLFFSAFYTFLLEGVLPRTASTRDTALMKTELARDTGEKAKTALHEKRYDEAEYYLRFYLNLRPDDLDVKKKFDETVNLRKTVGLIADGGKGLAVKAPPVRPENLTIEEMIVRAREYFEAEDYYSAEYYAGLAMKFDETRPEPKRIISLSRNKISSMPLTAKERENVDFFRGKREGYEMLSRKEYIPAYYHLKKLAELRPDDPDLRNYLSSAYEGLVKASFFLDEIALVAGFPLFSNVLFLNKREGDEREFLFFKNLIQTYDAKAAFPAGERPRTEKDQPSGFWYKLTHLFDSDAGGRVSPGLTYYVTDVEGFRISETRGVVSHFKAPYGKFIDRMLVLRCLSRDGRSEEFIPTYLKGTPPDKTPFEIEVGASPEEIRLLSLGPKDLERSHIWTLLSLPPIYRSFGFEEAPIFRTFFDHLFYPFSFVILSFFALGFGWRFRSRYLAKPPIVCFFFLPVLPFLVGLFFQLYAYFWKILTNFSLVFLGFPSALGVFLFLQGLLLLLALVFVAGQINR